MGAIPPTSDPDRDLLFTDPSLEKELCDIYDWLDARLNELDPRCDACGRCCRFTEYGHELWLTNVELEWLTQGAPDTKSSVCPWLEGSACQAREKRALGCRTFFCQGNTVALEELHEQALDRLRQAAARVGIELSYNELISSLRSRHTDGATSSPNSSKRAR